MPDFMEMNRKIENAVVEGYRKIEDGVVGGYKKIEEAAVAGYKKVEDKFIDTFLVKEFETTEEARERIIGKRNDEDEKA